MKTMPVNHRDAHAEARGANDFSGTWQLIRLALRRDRIVLPVWIILLGVAPVSAASSYEALYPDVASRAALSSTIGANPSLEVLYGHGYALDTAGGFTAWRLLVFLALFLGLMAVFTVTRHTRAEEDTGRAELLGSTVVGRYAMLTAAVLVSMGASALIGIIQAVTFSGSGMAPVGSWLFGLSAAGAGITFTAVAAVAAQLAEHSRTANGFGSTVLGVAFLLRALGDSTDDASWLSWLSPIGWTQQSQPFAADKWWVLVLPGSASAVLITVAYTLLRHRDVGSGILPPRLGPAVAATSLRSAFALAWRLHRASLTGWAIGLAVVGALFGWIAHGIGDIVGTSDQIRQMLERLGGRGAIIQTYMATMTGMFGMITAIYGAQATMRIRTEETAVRVEPLLSTSVSRFRFAASHLVFAFAGTTVLTAISALGLGLTHGARSGAMSSALGDAFAGMLAQLPAVWLVVGLCVSLVGLWPRFTGLSWAVVSASVLLELFGPIVRLPAYIVDISPFAHVPRIPGGEVQWTPLIVLASLAVMTVLIGVLGFRQRDIG